MWSRRALSTLYGWKKWPQTGTIKAPNIAQKVRLPRDKTLIKGISSVLFRRRPVIMCILTMDNFIF